ncbi:MAG: class I SAM-dependent methyltransferase [Methanothrix sp.]|nr:class I SAM-dependent methyltransferase [Methanothrix sp.]
MSYREVWDGEYRGRGRLWAGHTREIPELPAGSSVLELGCGDGKSAASMPDLWRVTALDISREAILLCRDAAPEASPVLGDACHLPFRSSSFDAVFSFHVMGHLPLPGRRAAASEASRVLRDGGCLFFREFGIEDMRAGRGVEVEPGTFLRGSGIITHYFNEREVLELFCDLDPLDIRTRCWRMRVKGRYLMRSEVQAAFRRRGQETGTGLG